MRNLDPSRARWIRRRGIFLGLLLGAFGVNVLARAWEMQVREGAAWRETAEKQRQRKLHVEPRRGRIVDRNERALALTIDVPSVSLDMHDLVAGAVTPEAKAQRVHDAASRLASVLSLDAAELERRMSAGGRFLWVKHRVSGEEAEEVRRLASARESANPIRGLGVDGEGRRYYPNREPPDALRGGAGAEREAKGGGGAGATSGQGERTRRGGGSRRALWRRRRCERRGRSVPLAPPMGMAAEAGIRGGCARVRALRRQAADRGDRDGAGCDEAHRP
jgi:cell division protein FtsI (penicillin-binding protein 3)